MVCDADSRSSRSSAPNAACSPLNPAPSLRHAPAVAPEHDHSNSRRAGERASVVGSAQWSKKALSVVAGKFVSVVPIGRDNPPGLRRFGVRESLVP